MKPNITHKVSENRCEDCGSKRLVYHGMAVHEERPVYFAVYVCVECDTPDLFDTPFEEDWRLP